MAAPTAVLNYTTANALLTKLSAKDILELTTEYVDAIEGVVEDADTALDYLDAVNSIDVDDLNDVSTHIAFVVLEKLKWAEGIVNSFGGRKYDVPMLASDSTIPGEIEDAVLVVCKYKLFSRRSHVPESIVNDYEQVMNWLERLADGKVVVNLLTSGGSAALSTRSAVGFADKTDVEFNTPVF